jgi:hypothetical protein
MGAACYVWIGLKSSCKVPAILVRFEWNFNFLNRISKNHEILNFMKILPAVAELFIADGRTGRRVDMTLIVAFHNFVNAPKNGRPIGRFCDIVPQTPVKAASFALYCTTHYGKKILGRPMSWVTTVRSYYVVLKHCISIRPSVSVFKLRTSGRDSLETSYLAF